VTLQQRTIFAVRSIVTSALSDFIKDERRTLTEELVDEGIQTSRAILGGQVLGTISLRKGSASIKVTDDERLDAYIRDNYPHTVIPEAKQVIPAHIDPAFRDHLLKKLKEHPDGGLFDPDTGEVLPVERTYGSPSLAFKPEADARGIVLRAFAAGELDPIRALMEGSE